MKIDKHGIMHQSADELCEVLYRNPEANINLVDVDDPYDFNRSIKELHYHLKPLKQYSESILSIEDFDQAYQKQWRMPESYQNLDISKWVLDQCKTEEELQRVGKELMMFQDRNLIVVLKFMKYFVDTMRKHKVVWGVGRGSSVSSYVLYLIGVHRINSIYYDLPIEEFLK